MLINNLTGYERVTELLPKKHIEKLSEEFEKDVLTVSVVGSEKDGEYSARKDEPIANVIARAGVRDGLKAVHFGAPLGFILPSANLGATIASLDMIPYSFEMRLIYEDTCIVDYLKKCCADAKLESCGRCVLCREAIKQLAVLANDITTGKGRPDDIDLLKELGEGMADGAYCEFGRGLGRLIISFVAGFFDEFDAHIRRKRCDALVCLKYVTFHILGAKCTGCGECLDACDDDAIAGKKKFIHVIDQDECVKCGKCLEACPEDAVVKAGPVKPRTPPKPVPVGTWKR